VQRDAAGAGAVLHPDQLGAGAGVAENTQARPLATSAIAARPVGRPRRNLTAHWPALGRLTRRVMGRRVTLGESGAYQRSLAQAASLASPDIKWNPDTGAWLRHRCLARDVWLRGRSPERARTGPVLVCPSCRTLAVLTRLGSQTGSQRRQTSGHIRRQRAMVSAARPPIRPCPATSSDAVYAPEKRKVGGSTPPLTTSLTR